MIASSDLQSFELPLDSWRHPKPAHPARWATKNIYLDSKITSTPGFYSLDQFPYCHAVFDAVLNPRVEKIILDWATQTGKTTWVAAVICWIAENAPGPTMIACANEKAAQAHYKRLLEPALERIASIRKRLPQKVRRRWQIVDLGNMFIFYAWPGSKATISDRPIKYLFLNEISLWPGAKGSEGDPLQMVMDRTKAFPHPGRKIIIEGKPTIEGECRLTAMLDASRKHTLYVPCPSCGEYQPLVKGRDGADGGIKWEEDYDTAGAAQQAAETVYWECRKCSARSTEEVKPTALAKSIWVPEGQSIENGKLVGRAVRNEREMGFHLNSFYSTVASWGDFAHTWSSSRDKPGKLQAVVNGWLAECWKIKARQSGKAEIELHRDQYESGTIPGEPLGVFLTIDVQQDRFYYVVRAWSYLATSWLVRDGMAMSWAELDEIEETVWPDPEGELHGTTMTTIDSAFRTNEVYEWCLQKPGRRVPIRGEHQYRQSSLIRVTKLVNHGLDLWNIDAGLIRDQFYDVRLQKKLGEPGAWAFGKDVQQDYVRAITAWERREKMVNGLKKRVWVSTSLDFEHKADCELQQEAIAFMARLADRRKEYVVKARPEDVQESRIRTFTHGIRQRGGGR